MALKDKTIIILELSNREITTIIGGLGLLENLGEKALVNLLLDAMALNRKTGGHPSLHSALLGLGVVVQSHGLEIILQLEKARLDPDSLVILEKLKGKYGKESGD
jgi:hypothetical protein